MIHCPVQAAPSRRATTSHGCHWQPIKQFINQINYTSRRHALGCVTGGDTIWLYQGGAEMRLAVVRAAGSERVATMNSDIAVPLLLSRLRRLKVPLQGPLLVALA